MTHTNKLQLENADTNYSEMTHGGEKPLKNADNNDVTTHVGGAQQGLQLLQER